MLRAALGPDAGQDGDGCCPVEVRTKAGKVDDIDIPGSRRR
jgi:hypothetical protein